MCVIGYLREEKRFTSEGVYCGVCVCVCVCVADVYKYHVIVPVIVCTLSHTSPVPSTL